MYKSTCSWPRHWLEVSGQLHAPAALPSRKEPPGIHWIGGWVGPRGGLDDVEKRKFFILPGLEVRPLCRPAPSQSQYRLRYPGSYSMGFEVLRELVMKSSVFWDVTPCSPLKVKLIKQWAEQETELCLPTAFTHSCSDYSSTLKMEAICSSEMSVDSTDYTALYPRG
jgi:hypothetical protein